MATVVAADERRHRPGRALLWGESWYFDFAAADASLGGFVRLGLYPNLGVAWYWAALVGRGRRLVLVRDHDIELPTGAALEVRGQGLWSAVNCETPLDHWSIGLEAFAVALDDPVEAYRRERGDLVGLGLDLEWEATAPAFGPRSPVAPGPEGRGGYGQACAVTGEILVGDEQLALVGTGHRGHAWGIQDWWETNRCRASGVLDDGTAFAARTGAGMPPLGYLWPLDNGRDPESAGPAPVAISATVGEGGLVDAAEVTLGELTMSATIVGHAPLLLVAPDGRRAHMTRGLCLYRAQGLDCAQGDGRTGVGWAEWLQARAEPS